ncbi:hypothetical protein D3C73_1255400 [compost metagenome]
MHQPGSGGRGLGIEVLQPGRHLACTHSGAARGIWQQALERLHVFQQIHGVARHPGELGGRPGQWQARRNRQAAQPADLAGISLAKPGVCYRLLAQEQHLDCHILVAGTPYLPLRPAAQFNGQMVNIVKLVVLLVVQGLHSSVPLIIWTNGRLGGCRGSRNECQGRSKGRWGADHALALRWPIAPGLVNRLALENARLAKQ